MKIDEELLERYRSNNCELAIALNDMKSELDAINKRMLAKEREIQTIYDENAGLKKELAIRDHQLNTWRTMFVDLVQTNTRKYTEVMQKIGLVPSPNGINKINVPTQHELTTPLTVKQIESNDRLNEMRRRKFSLDGSPGRLANLTEESLSSQANESNSLTPKQSPRKHISHVTARRRVSVPIQSPVSSPPKKRTESKIEKEMAGKKTQSKPMSKIPEISDENKTPNLNGRPSRRTAPKNLAEPKLSTKLRRN